VYCPKCQSQNEEGAQFCKNCGTNLCFQQEQKTDNVMRISWIISNISLILTALAIKNKSLKIIEIIFAAIMDRLLRVQQYQIYIR
jgi:uncharacterized membrane protein YvbJ